ncbi:hypothetical protein OIU84_018538 [Salix udensis]|uniref:Uncharacterized protein n=1 Tax=Salix udensis TaxID=889485 RepID=A0AAD6KWP6_9ROSI|nr:hypothetical protein OIU84_018538 [Salix udensis]
MPKEGIECYLQRACQERQRQTGDHLICSPGYQECCRHLHRRLHCFWSRKCACPIIPRWLLLQLLLSFVYLIQLSFQQGKPQFNLGTWVRNADPVVSSATVANRVAVATCPRRVPSVLINVVFIMV